MRVLAKALTLLSFVFVMPIAAYAQASVVGVVKDASGAVLPGVTVEAASPSLIEKTRGVTTDGGGQFRIVDLRPGTYTVTFALSGFNTVRRSGIELSGSFAATVNAELKVGAIEETITVTGEAPIVDVQSATKQRVMDRTVIDGIPVGRYVASMGVLIPGVYLASGTQDVGGATTNPTMSTLGVHGSKQDSQRMMQNGISLGSMISTGYGSSSQPNLVAMQEVALDYSSVSPVAATGGVNVNFIPRDGGNAFKGAFFGTFANSSMVGDNFTQDLKSRGLTTPNSIKETFDVNPGFGGPLKKDVLWFYTSYRYNVANNYAAGSLANANANNLAAWTYVANPSQPGENDSTWKDVTARLTWQASPKHKIGFYYDQQFNCACLYGVSATTSPESAINWHFPLLRQFFFDWSAPVTNRLLFEVVATKRSEHDILGEWPGLNPAMVAVQEQSTGLTYRGHSSDQEFLTSPFYYRVGVSYISGTHAIKVGLNDGFGEVDNPFYNDQPVTYRFNNGIPNQITERAFPYTLQAHVDHDLGLYAMDKWTVNRLTATYGLRFDYFASSWPAETLGPTTLFPARNLSFPGGTGLSWKDVAPKLGVSYDVFGDGKTAVKATLNKYLAGMATGGLANAANPLNTLVLSTTRSWTDSNKNFSPDCDLTNPALNNECGAVANSAFGSQVITTTYDPNLMTGWGKRPFNWEFSAGVQREILQRISVDVSYFRRWFGNFLVTDNLAVAPTDFTQYNLTVPADSRLPNGGAYSVSGLFDTNPNRFGQVNNFVTLSDNYGTQTEHWNFWDVTLSARPRAGWMFQGGTSTGKLTTDVCQVAAQVPEVLSGNSTSGLAIANGLAAAAGVWTPLQFCHQESPWLTQFKALGSYTIPHVDVQASATFQSVPGPMIQANWAAPNAVVAPALGRSLSGNAANATLNIVMPGSQYGDRLNQLDLRVGKILKFGGTRSALSVDLYNALNANPVLTENVNYAAFRTPTAILTARLVKVSLQFDF